MKKKAASASDVILSMERETYLERTMSKAKMLEDIEVPAGMEKVEITWDVIDSSTNNYTKLLQEYDIAEIVKSFGQRYTKSKAFHILPKPGNLDLSDTEVGFKEFYAELDMIKTEMPPRKTFVPTLGMRAKCDPITKYLLTGKHIREDKAFAGWKNAMAQAKKAKKEVVIGIISVDIPNVHPDTKGTLQYKCSGTQHYVSFAYDMKLRRLYQFDSASKNPHADMTEVYFILNLVFEELLGSTDFTVDVLKYRNILQPGAGDKKEEDERSYNNQNVFCHTWSMWFCLVFIVFYKSSKHVDAMKFLRSLSHRNPVLNLAMIKRFAGWLTTFLKEEEEVNSNKSRFPVRVYDSAKEKNDVAKLQSILAQHALRKNPYMGLNYLWNYKTRSIIKVERLCLRRKVKMDVDLLDTIEKLDINAYIEKSKEIRCPIGYFLNGETRRCRKKLM